MSLCVFINFSCGFVFDRFLVRCSYLEIYNEDVRDLLDRDHTTKKEV